MAGAMTGTKSHAGGGSVGREDLRLPYPFVPALTALEQAVAEVFGAVLRVEGVGVTDDFFDLGGDSLGGEQIALDIERRTGKPFAISALFDCPTPRLIAAHLQGAAGKAGPDATRIFVVHGRGGYTVLRPEFRAGLTRGAEITMFELPGIRGDAPVPETVADVAAAYVDEIGRSYPEGPIRLAAFCAGGLIALEMAAQLQRAGRPVAGLVLIDPSVPSRVRKRHRLLRQVEAGRGRWARFAYALRFGDGAGLTAPLGALAQLARRAEYRLRLWAILLRENWLDRLRGGGGLARYRSAALKALPRAKLITAYRFAWPEGHDGVVGIIASQERVAGFSRAGTIWERFAPERQVVTVAVSHREIGQGSAAEVADRMEAMLLGAEALARAG